MTSDWPTRRLLSMLMVCAVACSAIADNSISVGSRTVSSLSETAEIPVSLTSDVAYSLLDLEMSYDPAKLQIAGGANGVAPSDRIAAQDRGNIITTVDNTSGRLNWTFFGLLSGVINASDGVLFTITFAVTESIVGTTVPLAFEYAAAGDAFLADVEITATGGAITGPASIPISLKQGWNLIGAPADNLTPYKEGIIGSIWFWNGSRFEAVSRVGGKLNAGRGYWMYSMEDQDFW